MCAKPLNASVLLMHSNVCRHEKIIYMTIWLTITLKIHSLDDTADEVIVTTTKIHKITKMSIVYTMTMLSDCYSYPYLIQSEDLAELAELWRY